MQDFPFRRERTVLKRYLEGRIIQPEDAEVIDELAMTGFIRKGFSLTEKRETAIVTELGKVLFKKG